MENTNINTTFDSSYCTIKQLVLPLDLEIKINKDDLVYTFSEVMEGIDIKKYLVTDIKDPRGRIGYNPAVMLKIVLFAFALRGYASTRDIADLCKNDIRFMWMLQYENGTPSHMTICNFINSYLKYSARDLFREVNKYIFSKDNVNLNELFIDGTKLEANANKYSFVWKKASKTNREKLFKKITKLIKEINENMFLVMTHEYETSNEYTIDHIESILLDYTKRFNIDTNTFVYGKGNKKTKQQRFYDLLSEYVNKAKDYSEHIKTCGEHRGSFSKTDKDATFMRVKRDYMMNGQLLPAYNLQMGICDEYVAVLDVNQYASDASCFVPLMEKFNDLYNMYPKYPVGDAGYGTYNNYLYCEEKGMEKYMKFSMYKRATSDNKYINDKFKVRNFERNRKGNLICPQGREFIKIYDTPVKGNMYERTTEVWECKTCNRCPLRKDCFNGKGNRRVNLNEEQTSFHKEVITNLKSEHGIEMRKKRSIQAEGTFGVIKYDRAYDRIVRRGLDKVNMEITIISTAFNIYKYHNKKNRIVQ